MKFLKGATGTDNERLKFLYEFCNLDDCGGIARDDMRKAVKQLWLSKHAFAGYATNVMFADTKEAMAFEGLIILDS